jgi:hypothetical protein
MRPSAHAEHPSDQVKLSPRQSPFVRWKEGVMRRLAGVFAASVPADPDLSIGEVVEVEMGRPAKPRRGDAGTMNRAVRVRESFCEEQGDCHWDPDDERMWTRILNCSSMTTEGWQLERGFDEIWFLPASPGE